MQAKLPSLSIFFPFYNDEGTVETAISDAYLYGRTFTSNLEVIAIHGGDSQDKTYQAILTAGKKHKDLVIINKSNNQEGYAVIKHGFAMARKEWVFYTDGDLQYHLDELKKLVEKQNKTKADVVNGYKTRRSDNLVRVILGKAYKRISKFMFKLPIRDTDCDFRLIRRSFLQKLNFESHDSSILPELVKKLELSGARYREIPVTHYPRIYGKSNYTFWGIFFEKLRGDLGLWWKFRRIKKNYWTSQKLALLKETDQD
ncbi:MAG: glycosyltransferase family 2 protein [bacterium]|nr:glycosyltransferase family 2 protein [bacterium]